MKGWLPEDEDRDPEGFKGLKGSLPFRLGTTSYILPAPIIPNIEFLGPYVDEVELVLFESRYGENLPSPEEIRHMASLARAHNLGYLVHLPTDVFLGDPEPKVRESSRETILRFYERTVTLDPRSYILHLERKRPDGTAVSRWYPWRQRIWESLEKLAQEGVKLDLLALENLDYGVGFLARIAEETGTALCIDVGHLLRYGYSVEEELQPFLRRCTVLHLHGVRGNLDHRGLDAIEGSLWESIRRGLLDFSGSVCVEVFSLEDLQMSLKRIRDEILSNASRGR